MATEQTIQDIFEDGTKITRALIHAALHVMREARLHDELIPVWEDEQVKWVRPEGIEAALEAAEAELDKAEAGR